MRMIVACFVAVIGLGLGGCNWVASGQAEPQAAVPAPQKLDVTALVQTAAWGPSERAEAARQVDGRFVAAGMEVAVRAEGPENSHLRVLAGSTSRVEAYELARNVDFGGLRRAGFEYFSLKSYRDKTAWGYDVGRTLEDGILLGPVSNNALPAID